MTISASINIKEGLREAIEILAERSDSARLDAELLLAHSLKRSRSYLYTWPERELNLQQQRLFFSLIKQRVEGQPVAYLIGEREFWSLPLEVSPATLIPRPETELLVELALKRVSGHSTSVLDMGCGSGAISLAIASECPQCQIIAVDRSAAALEVAETNRKKLQFTNLTFIQSDWFENLVNKSFDIIVSNPPYVEADSPYLQQGDVRFEPNEALVGQGEAGLGDLLHIINDSPSYLNPKGFLFLEHGYQQGRAVATALKENGFSNVETYQDLNALERVTMGSLS